MQIKKGGVISFRLPNETPNEFIDYLNNLKCTSGRTFSSRILQIFLKGLANEMNLKNNNDYVLIKVPQEISLEKRKWLQSKDTQQYLISILLQLIFDKPETTAVSENVLLNTQKNITSKTETFIFDNFIDLDD
jgi:hypothetical protein